jgi:molybdopterin converting factor small subunit
MKVPFELLALFRQKAGTDRLELEVPTGGIPTVLDALRAAEARLGGQTLLEGEDLRPGVLVFLKQSGGAARRVVHPAGERVGPGQAVVLSTAMGGG